AQRAGTDQTREDTHCPAISGFRRLTGGELPVEGDRQRRMVGPTLIMTRRTLDHRRARSPGEPGRGAGQIDPPPGVVVEGPAPVGPPGVRPRPVRIESTLHVDITRLVEHPAQPLAVRRQEPGILAVTAARTSAV